MRLPLTPGYNTVTLSPLAPCVTAPNSALTCVRTTITDLSLADWKSSHTEAIAFGDAIMLTEYELTAETLALAWDWDIPPPETLIRFIVLTDAEGAPALQIDSTPGYTVESHLLDTLPPGDYTAFVGWYTLPDVTRLPVSPSDAPGAASGWFELGRITVGGSE
ncbi:MAG: hypothetical protein AAF125_27800 [Chloroflexota bacterium]